MRFTRSNVAALRLAPGKPYQIVWDEGLPGFGVRLNPSGKVWVVQYRARGKSRRETIGKVDTLGLESARDAARTTLARVQLGADPYLERLAVEKQRSVTFASIVGRYLASAQVRLKPRSYEEVRRHLSQHWAVFHKLPVLEIDRKNVSHRLEEIARSSGPIAANRARAALSALFSYALGMGLADLNPVVGSIKPGDEIQRDRVLSEQELSEIWQASDRPGYGCIVRLLLLTGQRRDEVGGMRWSEIDLPGAIWTIPGERSKNGRSHEVPLTPQMLSILEALPRVLDRDPVFGAGAGGFSGWSKAKSNLDQRIATAGTAPAPWRLHDLRRTAATGMATLGVQPHIVEAVLNHVSGSRAGVAGVYNRASYRDEKRSALSRWNERVESLLLSHRA